MVAQALHWFDVAAFFRQIDRALASGGVLAAWTYGRLVFDRPEIDQQIDHFYYTTLAGHWPPQRTLVDRGYRDLKWPYPELVMPRLEMRKEMDLPALVGYLRTWSAVSTFRQAQGRDPVNALESSLQEVWGNSACTARWPIAIRAGRKP